MAFTISLLGTLAGRPPGLGAGTKLLVRQIAGVCSTENHPGIMPYFYDSL